LVLISSFRSSAFLDAFLGITLMVLLVFSIKT
jgi:hypothetical protein